MRNAIEGYLLGGIGWVTGSLQENAIRAEKKLHLLSGEDV